MTCLGVSQIRMKTTTNQETCSYEAPYVQLNFNFQMFNIQKLYEFIKCVKRTHTKSPWESFFFFFFF